MQNGVFLFLPMPKMLWIYNFNFRVCEPKQTDLWFHYVYFLGYFYLCIYMYYKKNDIFILEPRNDMNPKIGLLYL